MTGKRIIDSPEAMIDVIQEWGIIPFFRNSVPGWSIEEMVASGYMFGEAEGIEHSPWDWKIEAVRTGEIAYGKFIGGKAAFARADVYAELMNWRRSLPRYRLALEEGLKAEGTSSRMTRAGAASGKVKVASGKQTKAGTASEKVKMASGKQTKAGTASEKLMAAVAPTVLEIIRASGSILSRDLRKAASAALPEEKLRLLSPKYRALVSPSIKKNVMDSVIQFLQMGTWTVIGDFERVYRGPAMTYSGWQLSHNTTPELLFGLCASDNSERIFLDDSGPCTADCRNGEGRRLGGDGGVCEGCNGEGRRFRGDGEPSEGCNGKGRRFGGDDRIAGESLTGARQSEPFWAKYIDDALLTGNQPIAEVQPTSGTVTSTGTPEESRDKIISQLEPFLPGVPRAAILKQI